MTELRLHHSWDYFDEVVTPNCNDFFGHQTTWARMFNAAAALFHLHEWVFVLDGDAAQKELGQSFATAFKLWEHVEATVPKSTFIRDVANSSKHVILTRNPSTSITHIANTYIDAGYGAGAYGRGRYGSPSAHMEEAGGRVSFDDCARDVLKFWSRLMDAIRP
jgi:hypothetical protein